MSETPETASESSAMTTVTPANATARPEVAAAWPIGLGDAHARRAGPSAARVTMNSE